MRARFDVCAWGSSLLDSTTLADDVMTIAKQTHCCVNKHRANIHT